jgi:hypothetical protein
LASSLSSRRTVAQGHLQDYSVAALTFESCFPQPWTMTIPAFRVDQDQELGRMDRLGSGLPRLSLFTHCGTAH